MVSSENNCRDLPLLLLCSLQTHSLNRAILEVSMSSKKLLVVDDEKHIRMLYQEELEAEGYTVATSDGQENILAVIARETPRVVILDIKLGPDISGLDLLQQIRSKDQDLPVILSTAYDSFQHDLKSIAADFYVVKSVDLTELKLRVTQAMAKNP
jgi:DNA-binding response OmpR family regulator